MKKDVMEQVSIKEKNYKVISFKEIKAKPINWLFQDFLAYGKITMVQGDPGSGKTSLALKLASEFSNGITPYGEKLKKPIKTLLLLSEDDWEDTIRPKLNKMGARVGNVLSFKLDRENDFTPLTDERIEEIIKDEKIGLLIVDPIQAFLPDNVDMNKMSDVRPVMSHLINMANRNHCAVLILQHLNKNVQVKNVYRGSGSLDFNASARIVLTIMKPLKEVSKSISRNLRYAQITKSNIGHDNQCLFFRLDDDKVIDWVMKEELSEHELMLFQPNTAISKKEEVMNFLKKKLAEGELPAGDLIKQITQELGVSIDTVNIVKRSIGVKSTKRGANWYWYI